MAVPDTRGTTLVNDLVERLEREVRARAGGQPILVGIYDTAGAVLLLKRDPAVSGDSVLQAQIQVDLALSKGHDAIIEHASMGGTILLYFKDEVIGVLVVIIKQISGSALNNIAHQAADAVLKPQPADIAS